MSKFKQIQEEMVKWQQHNFPGRSSWVPLMGLGEELGELAEASSFEECYDAIGDCLIYIADYCNGMGYDLDFIIMNNIPDKTYDFRNIIANYGRICHSHLKQVQRIRMHEDHIGNAVRAIRNIIFSLTTFVPENFQNGNIKLEDVAWEVWLKVRQRDWQKDANKAHEKTQ